VKSEKDNTQRLTELKYSLCSSASSLLMFTIVFDRIAIVPFAVPSYAIQ
jgi:hypothetical protein